MFQFRRFPTHTYLIQYALPASWWVSPFGNLRIVAHLQLPEAYRSLSRPSSAPDAKAFPLRSFSLDLRRNDEANSVKHPYLLALSA